MGSLPIGLSGSRAAAIIGLSQYSTPLTVWQELMEKIHGEGWNKSKGYIYEPFKGNAATEFGKAFESAIIDLTEQATEDNIIDRERSYSLTGMDYVTCHIDGRFKGSGKMYEGKSCNHRAFYASWGEPGTDRIPQSYQVQNQHSMMLTGLQETTMGVLVFPKTVDEWNGADGGEWEVIEFEKGKYVLESYYRGATSGSTVIHPEDWAKALQQMGFFHTYHIEAKPDAQKLLLEMYEDFWSNYILTETPPEAVNYEDVRRVFTEPKGTLVVSGDPADWMKEFKDIGKEISTGGYLAKRRKFLKTQILKFAAEQTTVADDDCQEKIIFRDETGGKMGQFDGKTFRS